MLSIVIEPGRKTFIDSFNYILITLTTCFIDLLLCNSLQLEHVDSYLLFVTSSSKRDYFATLHMTQLIIIMIFLHCSDNFVTVNLFNHDINHHYN